MGFCKISSTAKHDSYTIIDNAFFNDFLVHAPAECTKAYLYGYFLASNESDNTIEQMSNMLGIAVQDLIEIFTYWQERGLVNLVQMAPIQVLYLPVKTAVGNLKKYNIGKYTDFNIIIQELFTGRAISSNEFVEYYTVIETLHMEPAALIEIARYAISVKGDNVGHRYITTIAKQWANENILTLDAVKQRIMELGVYDFQLAVVMKCLGSHAKADIEDKQMLDKWLQVYGFDFEVICAVANRFKAKKMRANIDTLDRTLSKYYELKLMTIAEIETYESDKQRLYTLARKITKSLGLYYEDVSQVVEAYILPFEQMGYSHELLSLVADYCFKQSIRTLEDYANILRKLYKQGVLDVPAFEQYIGDIINNDEKVKEILSLLGIVRRVNDFDRNFYNTWTVDWNYGEDIIKYAASISTDRPNAMTYMNKILSNWHIANISSLEGAKSFAPKFASNSAKAPADNFKAKDYSKEQLNSLFSNLDEVEV